MNKKFLIGGTNITLVIFLIPLLIIGINLLYNTNHYIHLIIGIIYIISITLLIKLYFSKSKIIYNTTQIICLILNIILIYNICEINKNYNYLENIIINKYEYPEYKIYVLKNTTYDNLYELEEKNIGILKENKENIKKIINTKIKANYKEYDSESDLYNAINTGKIQSFISNKENELNTIRSIDKIKIKKIK